MMTKVYLLSVPLDKDYKHTFYFRNATAQKQYFDSKVKYNFTDFTYQRKDSTIRIPIDYDSAIKCNYVMYQNTNESNKWFYAFITDYVWADEDTTTITIQTDVLQTYAFDYEVQTSFVEREHAYDDTIGRHTIPENLEVGDFTVEFDMNISDLNHRRYVLGLTADGDNNPYGGKTYCGMYSGVAYYAYETTDTKGLSDAIKKYAERGVNDAVKVLFVAPKFVSEYPPSTATPENGWVIESTAPKSLDVAFDKFESVYKPRNNKLNCFPYRYLLVSNNNGGSAIYQYEYFTPAVADDEDDNKVRFKCYGVLTPGCSIRLVPMYYKGMLENHEEGLNLGKYPICNWSSDEYTNWLTQNSVNIGINLASGVGQVIAGTAMAVGTGGLGGAVGGGVVLGGISTIANQMAQIHQMSFTAPQSRGNINCGDVITASNNNTFTFYGMTIKQEFMECLDNYFDMFGYKCNRVKVPEKDHREHWWFTKTIDANITGDIPQNDLETIKNCYNTGVTFWKDDIKNYNRSNAVLGVG